MSRTSPRILAAIAILFFPTAAGCAQPRPKIVGVANIAFKTANLEAARNFYGKVLGYREAFTLKESADGPDLTCFKVNDRQYIEVSSLQNLRPGKLIHVAFETTGARELRDYLESKGVAVPDKVQPGPDGNLTFTVNDPDGNAVEFLQYLPESIHSRGFGRLMPDTRVSDHVFHVGIFVKDRAAADRFYKDILGFRHLAEADTGPIRSVAMLVPDGNDFVEYGLNNGSIPTSPALLGVLNHVCLYATEMRLAYRTVTERGYQPPRQPALTGSGLWQLNLFDPDGSRTEIMARQSSASSARPPLAPMPRSSPVASAPRP